MPLAKIIHKCEVFWVLQDQTNTAQKGEYQSWCKGSIDPKGFDHIYILIFNENITYIKHPPTHMFQYFWDCWMLTYIIRISETLVHYKVWKGVDKNKNLALLRE